ncbi:hypothetical protein JIN84_00620 [Luteolibacter yonseiensis]|uniref:Alginate biosynthesis protein AlgF n=1 Tax=Luteolibacter yonseiensis TaxID=1144680 RepID=A0A934R233_9BACT|nr:hypothetical protein [Luteolibacter yonseiensis]MBK1814110.1 hypothetical protein [Luteolibacter yonseiensis]
MRILSFCLLLLFPTFIMAQEGRKVTCRVVALDPATPPPALLASSGDGAEIKVAVPTGTLSEEMSLYSKTDVFTFLNATDRKPAATATLPAGIKAAILLFVAGPKTQAAQSWRVFVIEDSAKNFPDGGAFVANFHNKNIRFVIGEHKIMLKPAGSTGVARPTDRDEFNMAAVTFQFQQDETWRDASESTLRFLPGTRYLMIAFVDPASGRPRIVTFQDINTKAPAAS